MKITWYAAETKVALGSWRDIAPVLRTAGHMLAYEAALAADATLDRAARPLALSTDFVDRALGRMLMAAAEVHYWSSRRCAVFGSATYRARFARQFAVAAFHLGKAVAVCVVLEAPYHYVGVLTVGGDDSNPRRPPMFDATRAGLDRLVSAPGSEI